MFKSLAAKLLENYLGDYFIGITKENIQVGLVNGVINLKNLEINPNALLEFNLPVSIKKGSLGSINLKLPWNKILGQSTNIEIEDLFLLVEPKMHGYDKNLEEILKKHKLKLDEIMKSEETIDPNLKIEQKKGWIDILIGKVIEKIFNNVEIDIKRIHIRYEDNITMKEPFSFGVILNHLKIESADENWLPSIITDPNINFHKLINVKGAAIYLDHGNNFIEWDEDDEEITSFSEAMKKLLPRETDDHQYLLEPMNMTLKLKFSREEIFEKSLPQVILSFAFDKMALSLNESQMRDILSSLENFSTLMSNQRYRHLRPKKKKCKLWWNYLVNAVLLDYRENKRTWSWEYIKQYINDRKQYLILWYKKRADLPYDQHLLEEIENRSTFEAVVSFRELGEALYRSKKLQSEQEAEQENSKKTFIGRMLFSSKPTLEEDVQLDYQTLKNLHETMEEEKININEKQFIVEYVKLQTSFEFSQIVVSLQQENEKSLNKSQEINLSHSGSIAEVTFDSLKMDLKIRETSFSFYSILKSFSLTDYHTLNGRSLITIPFSKSEKNIFDFEFHSDPLKQHNKTDTKIILNTESFDFFLSVGMIKRLLSFFKNSIPDNSVIISNLSNLSSESTMFLTTTAFLETKYLVNSKKSLDIVVNVAGPKIHFPEDFSDLNKTKLVLDVGTLSITSDVGSSQTVYQQEEKQTTEINLYREYLLTLRDFNISFIEYSGLTMGDSKEPLLAPVEFDLSLKILKNNIENLPKVLISSSFPSPISFGLSSNKSIQLYQIIRVLSMIDIENTEKKDESDLKSFQTVEKKKNEIIPRSLVKVVKEKQTKPNFFSSLFVDTPEEDSIFLPSNLLVIENNRVEPIDTNNPKLLSIHIEVPKIEFLFFKKTEKGIVKLINGKVERILFKMEQNKHNLLLNASVSTFYVKDRIQTFGDQFKWMLDSNEEDKDLISLTIESIPNTSPLFNGIEYNVLLSFSGLTYLFNRETMIYLLNYVDDVAPHLQPLISNAQIGKQRFPRNIFDEIQEKVALLSKGEDDLSTLVKLDATFGPISGAFASSGVNSFLYRIGLSRASVDLRNNGTMSVVASVGRLTVTDGLESGVYSKMISTSLEETVKFEYHISSVLLSQINIQVSPMQVILLNKSLENMTNYFEGLEEIKISMENYYKRIAKLFILRKNTKAPANILINNFSIVIPKNSCSEEILLVELEKIYLNLFDRQKGGQDVNVFLVGVQNLSVKTGLLNNIDNSFFLVENTSIDSSVERLVDVSCHSFPSTSISAVVNEMQVNISDYMLGMVLGLLEGNMMERPKKLKFTPIQRKNLLVDKRKVIFDEQLEDERENSNSVWEIFSAGLLIENIFISFFKDSRFNTSSLLSSLFLSKTNFLTNKCSNNAEETLLTLNQIILIDKDNTNSKFPKLLHPLFNEKEKNFLVANFKSDENNNRYLSVLIEQFCLCVTDSFLKLSTMLLPFLQKFSKDFKIWEHSNPRNEQQVEKIEKIMTKKHESFLETTTSFEVVINNPQVVFIEDLSNSKSNYLLLQSNLKVSSEMSKEAGLRMELQINQISLSKHYFEENFVNKPCNPFNVLISFEKQQDFAMFDIETDNINETVSYQSLLVLVNIFQNNWVDSVYQGAIEREEKLDHTELIESNSDHDERSEKEYKQMDTTISMRTGTINLILVDELSTNPIASFEIDPITSDTTIKYKSQFHGVVDIFMKADYFNFNNQTWEPLLRSTSSPREGVLMKEGSWGLNLSVKKEEELKLMVSPHSALNLNISQVFLSTLFNLTASHNERREAKIFENTPHQCIVRNQTGEKIQFWISGSNQLIDVSSNQEVPLEELIVNNNKERTKRELETTSINFILLSSKEYIKDLPLSVVKSYCIPVNSQTVVFDVSFQNNTKVCTLKSNFSFENSTDFPLHFAIKEKNDSVSLLYGYVKPNEHFIVPLSLCEKSMLVSPDPERYAWSDPINLMEISDIHRQLHSKHKHKNKEVEGLLEKYERVLRCIPKLYNTSNLESTSVDPRNINMQKMIFSSETKVERKPNHPLFFAFNVSVKDDPLFNTDSFHLKISPPLVLSNLLAQPIKFWTLETHKFVDYDEGTIQRGDKVAIYSLDPRESNIGLSIRILGFDISNVVNISGRQKDLATIIPLTQTSTKKQFKRRPLFVSIDYLIENNRTEISLYVNYWIMNKTNLYLLFKNPAFGSKGGSLPGQNKDSMLNWNVDKKGKDPYTWFEREKEIISQMKVPLMYNSDKLKVRVGKSSSWSSSITLSKYDDEGTLEITDGERLYVFGLSISHAPGLFWRTKILKLVNKYVLVNNSQKIIQYKQPNTELSFLLKPGDQTYFHWPSKSAPQHLCVKYFGDEYPCFSGPFSLVGVSLIETKFKNTFRTEQVNFSPVGEERVTVQTLTKNLTTAVIFREESEHPLYLLRNNTSKPLSFRQNNSQIEQLNPVIVPPFSDVAYAWSEPSLDDKKIVFGTEGSELERQLEYSPDEISDSLKPLSTTKLRKKNKQEQRSIFSPRIYFEGITKILEVSLKKEESNDTYTNSQSIPTSLRPTKNVVFFSLSVLFPGIAISILDDSPQEVMNMYIENIRIEAKTGNKQDTLDFRFKDIQIDNQLFNTPHPIVMTSLLPDKDTDFVTLHINKSNLHKELLFFNDFQLFVQGFDINMDQAFLTHLIYALGSVYEYMKKDKTGGIEDKEIDYVNKRMDVSNLIYFNTLEIGQIHFTLSYTGCPWASRDLKGTTRLGKLLDVVGNLSDMQNAPITLEALKLYNPFLTRTDLMSKLMFYYEFNLARQIHRVLGSFNVLGNPINLLQETGMKNYEPHASQVARQNEGGKPSGNIFKRLVFGVFGSNEKASSSIGNVTSNLTMDKKFIEKRQIKQNVQARDTKEGIVMGTKDFSKAMLKGVTGIVIDPIKGAKRRGGVGFLKGLGTGITGIITKPVTGIMDITTRINQGIKNSALGYDEHRTLRIRSPRYIDRSNVLSEYNGMQSEGQEILMTLKDGLYKNEVYLYHFPDLLYVPQNGDQFILVSNNHLFFLKGSKFGRITKEWKIGTEDIESLKLTHQGINIRGTKNKKFLGVQRKKKVKEINHNIPFVFSTGLYVYYCLSDLIKKQGKRQTNITSSALSETKTL